MGHASCYIHIIWEENIFPLLKSAKTRLLYLAANLRHVIIGFSQYLVDQTWLQTNLESSKSLHKLHLAQNCSAARVITRTPSAEHITPALQQLHWLPIKSCIDFKILHFTFKILHNLAPPYLAELIHIHTSYPHILLHSPFLFYHPAVCPICQPNHHGVTSFQQICPQPLELSPTRHSHFWHCLVF